MNPSISLLFLFLACAPVSRYAPTAKPGSPPDATQQPLPAGIPEDYSLLYSQDFSGQESRADFIFSDPDAWKVQDGSLNLVGKSAYKPPVRSPRNLALIRGKSFGDFVLEAELQSTGREYGHLDMCLFFGFQSRDHFYYAHVAQAADDHAHNFFRVDGSPRIKFAVKTTKGIRWGKGQWHKLRLIRDSTKGKGQIELYFGDMSKPIIVGEDRTFTTGQIGFGSFDDTGMIRKIRIWGKLAGKATDLGFISAPDKKGP